MKSVTPLILLLSSLILSSCGGGTGGTSVTPAPNPVPGGGVSTISAAQLQGCPLGDFTLTGKVSDSVSACLRGVFSGTTTQGGSDACQVEYNGDTVTYTSAAFRTVIGITAKTKVHFGHTTLNGQHTISDDREQLDADGYAHLLYSQALGVTGVNVTIHVASGSQRGDCYVKI